jgi:hypothetical protein
MHKLNRDSVALGVKLIGKIQSTSLHPLKREAGGAIQRMYIEGILLEREVGVGAGGALSWSAGAGSQGAGPPVKGTGWCVGELARGMLQCSLPAHGPSAARLGGPPAKGVGGGEASLKLAIIKRWRSAMSPLAGAA